MLTWAANGNFLTDSVCVLGFVLPTAHPLLLLAQFFWSIPSVKDPSLTQCLWGFRELSTTCLFSKRSTTFLCIPSICWELLVSSVVLFSLLCTDLWSQALLSARQQRMSPKTTDTSSDKKKKPTTL